MMKAAVVVVMMRSFEVSVTSSINTRMPVVMASFESPAVSQALLMLLTEASEG